MRGPRGLRQRLRRGPLRRCLDAAARIAASRGEGLYLVGGSVRDLLLGGSLRDLDLVVEGDPAAVGSAIAGACGGRLRSSSAFGTCRVESETHPRIDLAMSRRETYAAPAALPEVSPAPIEEDLLRRDLTINSMALALAGPSAGEILDPSGGLDDLRARRLRLHHERSLADDPTRAFRAARHAVRFGLRPTPLWRRALVQARRARSFDRLTSARRRREVALIWGETDPAAVLRWCDRQGLLRHVHPALRATAPLLRSLRGAAAARRRHGGAEATLDLFWALLAASIPARARGALADRIGIRGAARRRLLSAASAAERLESARAPSRGPARASLLARGSLEADVLEFAGSARARRLHRRLLSDAEKEEPRLRGAELLDLGVPEGPGVGKILNEIRHARRRGKIRTRAEEADWVRARIRRSRLH
jgi:tRNA nucleotidyltransferase (CCA-adding enzyme)